MAKYPDGEPFDGPVKVVVEFWKAKRGRPDLDNLVKLVTDALNGVAYRDDEQIQTVEGRCLRAGSGWSKAGVPVRGANAGAGDRYTCHGVPYEPFTFIHITPLPEWDPRTATSTSVQVKEESS